MAFVLLSAFFTSIFSLCYKIAHRQGCNPVAVNGSMLVVGTVFSFLYILVTAQLRALPSLVILLGLLAGVCFFISVATFFVVVRKGNLSISWTVIALSIVIPLIASVVLWKESPSYRQILGAVGTVVALVLLGVDQGRTSPSRPEFATKREFWGWIAMLIIAFLGTGLIMLCNKALVENQLSSYIVQFTFLYYLAGTLSAIPFLWLRRAFPQKADLKVGAVMAISGVVSFILFLHALRVLPGVVVFPLRSIVNITLTAVFSLILWREKLSPVGWIGLIVAAGSIFFMR